MVSPLDTTSVDHPSLRFDLEFDALLRDASLTELHLSRERRRISAALEEGGWGFCSENSLAVVRPLPWDTDHFGFSCADLVRFYATPDASATESTEVLDMIIEACRQRRTTLLSARIQAGQLMLVNLMTARGFELVDTSVELGSPGAPPSTAADGVQIRSPMETDRDALLQIAASFTRNRFFVDPKIPDQAARAVYSEWVSSAMAGSHGQLILAEVDGRVAGFTTLVEASDPLRVDTVGLVAVHPDYRGRNVLGALLAGCGERFNGRATVTSTQVSNSSALRAFARSGLLPFGARHVLHGWL